ncbi:dCTP deaminase [Candidatus Pacearchaeota archaeon]|nr:dCTP deaminase [Candidatus Pacearchaeota archaeon]
MVVKITIKVNKLKYKLELMLSDRNILSLIKKKKISIIPFNENNLGCASIDLSLSDLFLKYTKRIDTQSNKFSFIKFKTKKLILKPGEFILGMTSEKVKLTSKYFGFIETRGNFSRAGISITCDDGHIDPGANGHITLEIQNKNTVDIILYAGDLICQLFFFLLSSSPKKLYSGKYSKQQEPREFLP